MNCSIIEAADAMFFLKPEQATFFSRSRGCTVNSTLGVSLNCHSAKDVSMSDVVSFLLRLFTSICVSDPVELRIFCIRRF
jgi:hypothetical protein